MKLNVILALLLAVFSTVDVANADYLTEWDIVLSSSLATLAVEASVNVCAEGSSSHGKFVSCVAKAAAVFVGQNLITTQQAAAINKQAAKSKIGRGNLRGP